jgi:hypothetical protein
MHFFLASGCMGKFDLFFYVILPIVSCLGVYGVFIVARLRKVGWDIKGLMMLMCLVIPGLGFIITVIVWAIRNRRLKKAEKKEQISPGISPVGNLFHYRLFLFLKEFTLIMVSFIIGRALTWLTILSLNANINNAVMNYEMNHAIDSLMSDTAFVNQIHRDSKRIEKRKDSITHRVLDSIIQTRIDSIKLQILIDSARKMPSK